MALAPLPEEILDRFRSSSRNRLTQVEAAWNASTSGIATEQMLVEMHRNVHTLKGDARMVQFQDIDLLCQKLEDLLAAAEANQYQVSSDIDLSVSMALDFIGLLLRRRGDQEITGIDLRGFVLQVQEALKRKTTPTKKGRPVFANDSGHHAAIVQENSEADDSISRGTRNRLAKAATKVFLEYLSASGVARTRLRSAWLDLQHEIERLESEAVSPIVERHALAVHALALDLKCKVEVTQSLQPDLRISADASKALDVALMHVLRNALSHGISGNEGSVGKLRLSSRVKGDVAHIVVTDTGIGINVEEVRKRASELGIMHPDIARDATREELLELLFEPRFTTRDRADEIAGRGIGLDIVRTEICKVGGNVKIDGRPGEGTSLTIFLPSLQRHLDIHLFDAYGGRLVLGVPASWAVTQMPLSQSTQPVDPLGRLQVRRPSDDTGLTQSGPPQILRFAHSGFAIELVAAKGTRMAIAHRICPTPDSFPAEVVTVDGAEVLLLRPHNLPPAPNESKEA